ncbi:immunoglobulin superfamily member 10 [Solea senegalensis]|nr:immunoglobulin superfamily member 10 isoform X2 [Solea senegalensis]XP_043887247.1 immunoglobulin superfamily member 10 isoform X2 [Solea senegalensis]KAG7480323.1 immunoglobulin superfamily member 10 [Solea senegalensis]
MSVCACNASYLRRWLLKVVLFLATVLQTSAGCPKSCACSVPTEVHCTFRYLTAIPDHIQPAVERINLGYNSITVLRENDLPGLENVLLLMLHSNTIESIEDRTFQDLKSLQVLKMSYNKVKQINKETFKGLDSLLRLQMDHNHIEFISPEAFYGLTNLQFLHLESNHLQQLHPDTFITLRHSQVFKVSSVKNIHLSENLLTTLPADIFAGCSQLENVFLHGNPWTCDCHMNWFPMWAKKNTGVLKCKRDRRYPNGQLCPVCENPAPYYRRPLSLLSDDAFTCTKPWIHAHLKQNNISLEEGDFTPVSPKDFVAPLGSIQMNLTDSFHSDASLSCTVQRPNAFENLTQTLEQEEGNNVTVLTAGITTYLVCNIDYEHIQQLWQILAAYSDSPLRLQRGLMLTRSPEMVYRYSQLKTEEEEERIYTNIEAEIKASPSWLMQGEVSFQLDRTTTTFSTLHIKYQSVVNLRVESTSKKRDHYTWTMIKRDNQTKTEHTVLTGGVAELSCQIQGEPKPLLEWILPDGNKVRAPYTGEDRRITITAEGKLIIRRADSSDTGLYRCIVTNYLDADILVFRLTVLSPDVEETDVNGVHISRPLGGNLAFDCSSSGSPKGSVQWILPDHSVVDVSHGNRKVYKNGTLLIQGLTERDRGFYRCLVANHLGADLLVSQVTVTGQTVENVIVLDNEGSGMEMDFKVDDSLIEKRVGLNEIPSSIPSDRNSQESMTVTYNRPYPRHRLQGRGGSGSRLGQRRRMPVSNRRIWSRKVFDKTSRKVNPDKFAELMKKAQDGLKKKTEKEKERVIHEESHPGYFGDGETGSGLGLDERFVIVSPGIGKPNLLFRQDNQTETSTPAEIGHNHMLATTEAHKMVMKTTDSHYIDYSEITEKTNTLTAESYMQSDSTPIKSTFTEYPSFVKKTDFYTLLSNSPSSVHPVNLQLTVEDTSQETQLQFSGEHLTEPETSTGPALSFTTDSNIAPMKDGPGKVGLVVHTDPEGQTTFTAITTTDRKQDEITFHTTQTIKSPHLPAGSTIISQQQIHIIPHKNGRDGERRRTFQGRRRFIKPNRIPDIQSFINKLKQSSVIKDGNASVPYRIELTTACDCEEDKKKTVATRVLIEAPLHQTKSPTTTKKTTASPRKNFITFNTPITRTESKSEDYVASGDMTRLNRPFITQKTSTTAQTTTTALTTTFATMPTPTSNSMAEPETLSPTRRTESIEGSIDDDNEDSSSADFEVTTLRPNFQHIATTSSPYYSRYSTTAGTPPELQTLPSPPTIKPPSVKHLDESSLSGSGGLSDNLVVIRQRPGGTRGRQGQRRRPFRGRRPFKRPVINKLHPVTTTVVSTTETTPQQTISLYKPLYTQSRVEDKTTATVSTDQTSKTETKLYDGFAWSASSILPAYTTNKTPSITTTYNPTTTSIPSTTKESDTTVETRVQSNIRPPTQRNNDLNTRKPQVRRPTVQSNAARASTEKDLSSDTVTVRTVEQRHTNTPATYNNIGTHNAIPNHVANNEATSANIAVFESTTKVMTSKPKIVGGNAASFTILSNSDAFLPCEAVGNPRPDITWKRFSTRTGNSFTIKGTMDKFQVLSNGTLFIQNASIADRGQYLCLAENDHGSDKLLVTLSVVAYPSRILEPKVREMKFRAGTTVEMKCKAEGRPTPMISWILANRTQVREQNAQAERVAVSAEGTLVIKHVTIYDRGNYKCIASNPAGADTATVRLQVVAAPPGIVEEKRQQLKVSASENLWLPCSGEGSPQPAIHWVLHDGTMVRSNNPARETRVSVYENGTLHIKGMTPADSGIYECIATSSTGSERRVVTLAVERRESAPQIVETSQYMTEMSFGDQLRLNCSAKGDPKPRIMWRLPSKAVVDQWHRMGRRIQVLDNGTLIINIMSNKDAGDYLCVARNKIGDDLQLMRVSVSMKPAKIEPKKHNKKQVAYGNDLKVDCKASGEPKPEISWGLPDGTLVNSALQADASNGGGRARRYTIFDNGTLYLNQVGMSEEGDYTCYAENQVGKDEMHVHITVVATAPRIRPPSQTFARVTPSSNVRFDCEALGEPKPKVLWVLPTNDVIAASNERYLMHVNGSLNIRDVKAIDAGDYVCMARNPAGEDRKVYTLDIDGNPPVINGYHQNRTVIKDAAPKFSRKLIDCNAKGNPTPSITWLMPDNIFLTAPYFGSRINVHHNGTLEIRNVRPTDIGEFICIARNDGGEAVMVVQLEVTSMLQRPLFNNPYNERIVSRSGKTVVLNCSAVGNPMPEIFWTLPNGTRFTGEPDRGSRHHLGNDGTLIIYNPLKEDAGKYRCGAKNFIGYIEKLIILDIGQKPYILTRPRGIVRSMSGEHLFLHCLSDGSPKPRTYWIIPSGHTLTLSQVLGRYQVLENGTLIVHDTTVHDRGKYICRAQNDGGEAVLTVPVVIIGYPPRITTAPPPGVRAITGTPIQLNCFATGIPKPEIIWELPDRSVLSTAEKGRPLGSELLHPQGTLIIQKPTVSDSGTYKCLAKNHLGTDSKATYLRVL